MAIEVSRRWLPSLSAGGTRANRRGCDYEAYVPDPVSSRSFVLEGSVAADVSDAEAAIRRLNAEAGALVDTEGIARLLLRAEAVASSRIEGLEVGARRLLRAEVARGLGASGLDVTATEVLRNIDAMTWAVTEVAGRDRVAVADVLDIHRRLLEGTRLSHHAGRVRTEQNWIGGRGTNPCSAVYVPPPPEELERLLVDLCEFSSSDDLPPVAQAAVAHAQFETIHPFADGNGRTGRALIHVILRRRGVAPRVVPPISLILATQFDDYIGGLVATRYIGPADAPGAQAGINRWIGIFAAACTRAVHDAGMYERTVQAIEAGWRERLSRVRKGSATDLLLTFLAARPIVTVGGAAGTIGRSFEATNNAIDRLVATGILRPVTVGRRNRAFEAVEIIDAFSELERRTASPEGDTLVARPARRVPRRRA